MTVSEYTKPIVQCVEKSSCLLLCLGLLLGFQGEQALHEIHAMYGFVHVSKPKYNVWRGAAACCYVRA